MLPDVLSLIPQKHERLGGERGESECPRGWVWAAGRRPRAGLALGENHWAGREGGTGGGHEGLGLPPRGRTGLPATTGHQARGHRTEWQPLLFCFQEILQIPRDHAGITHRENASVTLRGPTHTRELLS